MLVLCNLVYRQIMEDRQEELRRFKKIDLRVYAASRGFLVDKAASSRSSTVMRHSNGDKIGIGKTPEGNFVYYNYKNEQGGSIIDFVIAMDGGNLGHARRTLRQFDGSEFVGRGLMKELPLKLQPSEHDASRVLAAWMKSKPIGAGGHPYLTEHRKIPVEVQRHPIFEDRIRIDHRRNAVFPHFSRSGLCGFELKNGDASGTTFTGFSPGGIKGLACSRPRDTDTEMVVSETSVDMLSLATLEGTQNRRFFSTSGQFSAHQAECLRTAADRMPSSATCILLALDNDEGGRRLAKQIREVLGSCGLPAVDYFPKTPGSDWNDQLCDSDRPCRIVPQVDRN
ncbi:MAG: DUF3991 and TOPRIM domain-containing protein [Planctomycetota bacterium]